MARSPSALERHNVDVHVGKQLAAARLRKGLNQSEVGRMLGLTFQQIQKYEKGTNRMSASVLWTLVEKMDLPITYFFEGLAKGEAATAEHMFSGLGRVGIEMAEVYATITPQQQRLLLELAKSFAPSEVKQVSVKAEPVLETA